MFLTHCARPSLAPTGWIGMIQRIRLSRKVLGRRGTIETSKKPCLVLDLMEKPQQEELPANFTDNTQSYSRATSTTQNRVDESTKQAPRSQFLDFSGSTLTIVLMLVVLVYLLFRPIFNAPPSGFCTVVGSANCSAGVRKIHS